MKRLSVSILSADFGHLADQITKLPLDVHLMIENPDRYLEAFVEAR